MSLELGDLRKMMAKTLIDCIKIKEPVIKPGSFRKLSDNELRSMARMMWEKACKIENFNTLIPISNEDATLTDALEKFAPKEYFPGALIPKKSNILLVGFSNKNLKEKVEELESLGYFIVGALVLIDQQIDRTCYCTVHTTYTMSEIMFFYFSEGAVSVDEYAKFRKQVAAA